jgi:hypothetical protein
MQFSSIPTLIDAHILSLLEGTPLKGASLFLFVTSKTPLTLQDANKVQLTASVDDQQAHHQSYEKIEDGTNVCLENVVVHVDFGKGHSVNRIDLSSKRVLTDIGSSSKEKEIKNFELRVTLNKLNGELPLAISTYNYLRRMERQELVKKHYKPSTTNVLAFTGPARRTKRPEPSGNAEVEALDSESIGLLRGLLNFVDKDELFRVLLKKPLKDRQSKKAVRLCIIPTDVEEESEGFEIRKKTFNRNTILELLAEYEAREERTRN